MQTGLPLGVFPPAFWVTASVDVVGLLFLISLHTSSRCRRYAQGLEDPMAGCECLLTFAPPPQLYGWWVVDPIRPSHTALTPPQNDSEFSMQNDLQRAFTELFFTSALFARKFG